MSDQGEKPAKVLQHHLGSTGPSLEAVRVWSNDFVKVGCNVGVDDTGGSVAAFVQLGHEGGTFDCFYIMFIIRKWLLE